ncbi:MAG: V-type ATP synthase subunit D [Spirochaetes bacterium]|nr:V-type ATP synthase subunit D [Spirochaetota bacterium]
MAKLNIPPTKSNLHQLKQSGQIAREGYELLDQKREILVIELMSYLERTKRVEKDMDKLITDAYRSFTKAVQSYGHKEIEDKSRSIKYPFSMQKKTIKLMGMSLPSAHVDPPRMNLQYSYLNTNAIIDETSKKFLKLISALCEMAEIRTIVWRLSREVKKTQRRVNALEKVVIPETEETLKFIEGALEERERDELFITKMVKSRLQEDEE